MIRMKMTAKDDNLFTLIKFWKLPFIVVKNVVAVRSFNQKSTVVNGIISPVIILFHIL